MDEKQIFISYKSEELFEAQCLKELLEKNGISVWMAPMCIVGGSSYAVEIPRAIRGCKVFVLVLSERSQASKWVSREVDLAINEGKVIMPFMLENCPLKDDFSFYLTNVQRYAAYENKVAAAEKMIKDIKDIIGSAPATPPEPSPRPQPQMQTPKAPFTPPPQPPKTEFAPPTGAYAGTQQTPGGTAQGMGNAGQGQYSGQAPGASAPMGGFTTQYYASNNVKPKKDSMSTLCAVLGIVSLCTAGMLVITEIIAVILAISGVRNLARSGKSDGLMLTGLITGLISGTVFISIATFGAGTVPMVIVFAVCCIVYSGQKKKGRNEFFMQMNMMNGTHPGFR